MNWIVFIVGSVVFMIEKFKLRAKKVFKECRVGPADPGLTLRINNRRRDGDSCYPVKPGRHFGSRLTVGTGYSAFPFGTHSESRMGAFKKISCRSQSVSAMHTL